MSFSPVDEIKVSLNFTGAKIPVGRLATREGQVYFEYKKSFIKNGLELSPLNLPLQPGLKTFDRSLFEGLPGVFNDSLPDGWGRLLLDRTLRASGILLNELSPLDRLSYVSSFGMGALVYEPDHIGKIEKFEINLDSLASYSQQVLEGEAQDVLQELLLLNGSSAGARPKALIGVDVSRQSIVHGARSLSKSYEPWMVKFTNANDSLDAGAIEYVYALMAKDAGLCVADIHLFPSQRGAGYFATKRFDRNGAQRIHTHSACGLLHSDFRTPSLDYEDLIALTNIVTRDVREAEKMFRLAVFNVLVHNRDDHAKNFSFLMDQEGEWKLSPAYDLTFSSGPRGEQSTMVLGEGKSPSVEHLIKLGQEAKIDDVQINRIIDRVKGVISRWDSLAREHGVSEENIKLISRKLSSIQ